MLRTIPSLTPGSSGSATVPRPAGGRVGDPVRVRHRAHEPGDQDHPDDDVHADQGDGGAAVGQVARPDDGYGQGGAADERPPAGPAPGQQQGEDPHAARPRTRGVTSTSTTSPWVVPEPDST